VVVYLLLICFKSSYTLVAFPLLNLNWTIDNNLPASPLKTRLNENSRTQNANPYNKAAMASDAQDNSKWKKYTMAAHPNSMQVIKAVSWKTSFLLPLVK